jgi:hypothetical protein
MTPIFQKAQRSQVYLKLALTGPSGAGKTYSALRLAVGLIKGTGKRIAVIDTENRSASLYSETFDFDALELEPPFEHPKFTEATYAAVDAGYGVVIIDSASHFWEGILEYKAKLDSRPGSNSYTNWNEAGKKFKDIIDAVLQSNIHVICCLRSKMDYVMETNDKGKTAPRKIGLAPIMRDGIEYEFTTVFDIALDHNSATSKDRSGLFTDKIFQITEDTGETFAKWLSGAIEKPRQSAPVVNQPQPQELTQQTTPEGYVAPINPPEGAIKWEGEIVHETKFMDGITAKGRKWRAFIIAFLSGKSAVTYSEPLHEECKRIGELGGFCLVTVTPSKKKQGNFDMFSIVSQANDEDNIPM